MGCGMVYANRVDTPSFFALPLPTSSSYYSFLESDVLVPSSGVPTRAEKALC